MHINQHTKILLETKGFGPLPASPIFIAKVHPPAQQTPMGAWTPQHTTSVHKQIILGRIHAHTPPITTCGPHPKHFS